MLALGIWQNEHCDTAIIGAWLYSNGDIEKLRRTRPVPTKPISVVGDRMMVSNHVDTVGADSLIGVPWGKEERAARVANERIFDCGRFSRHSRVASCVLSSALG